MTGLAIAEAPPELDWDELDLEDRARLLVMFRGVPASAASARHRGNAGDGLAAVYKFDALSGMVYIRD